MEDVLKELLDTELQAEALVKEANARYEQLIRDARTDAQAADQEFISRLPSLFESHLLKIEDRTSQTVAELRRRYDERRRELRSVAEGREREAIEAAVDLITDPAQE